MPTIPEDFFAYKRSPVFTQDSIPASLLEVHSSTENTWAQINIKDGSLMYYITQPEHKGQYLLDTDNPGVIASAHSHFIELIEQVTFYIEFYCRLKLVSSSDMAVCE